MEKSATAGVKIVSCILYVKGERVTFMNSEFTLYLNIQKCLIISFGVLSKVEPPKHLFPGFQPLLSYGLARREILQRKNYIVTHFS